MIAGGVNILYVITDLDVGGVPIHLSRLAAEMKRRGAEVAVVSLAIPGPVAERFDAEGIPVLTCSACCGWDARVFSRLARVIRDRRPTLIHSLLFHANLAARVAARLARFPANRVIAEIQTVEIERRWHLRVDRLTHRGSRFTIGNSPSVVDHLAAVAHIPRERLRLVRGGVNAEPIRSARQLTRSELGLPEASRVVLWVGRLDPIKGLDVLIEAFSRIDRGMDTHLLIVGGGPLRQHIERQVESSKLTDRVHLLGSRNDVPRLLKSCDVFAFPSRTEGLPNALLEAMAAGIAIVTTDAPGCRDLIEHDRTGLLVPRDDTQALFAALMTLLHDAALRVRLGAAAASDVDRRWNARAMYDAYAEVYAEAVK